MFISFFISWKLRRTLNNHQREKAEIKTELEKALDLLKLEQSKYKCNDSVSELVGYRIAALTELYHSVRVKIKDAPKGRSKRIIPLSALLQMMNEKSELLDINLSDSFWRKMRMSVDGEMKGIVTFVEKKYPNLSESEVNLFSLYCARISPQIIKLCMNFDHTKTASNYKRKLIKTKMGLNMSFDEFVEQYLSGVLS